MSVNSSSYNRVHQQEIENKMSLHNLAMVFGPTLLRPGPTTTKQKDLLESSTADVMTQAGILYSFLQARLKWMDTHLLQLYDTAADYRMDK